LLDLINTSRFPGGALLFLPKAVIATTSLWGGHRGTTTITLRSTPTDLPAKPPDC